MRQLAERPFREVATLLNKVASQLNAQALPPQKKQAPIDPGPPAQGGARGDKRK